MVHTTATTHHFYYDLEKVGYRGEKKTDDVVFVFDFLHFERTNLGYERRHYPLVHRASVNEVRPTIRQQIYRSPSANFDEQWRPHIQHIEPKYTE